MTDFRTLGLGPRPRRWRSAPAPRAATTSAGAPAEELGTCAAADHQDWVGKRVDVLNDVDLPEGTRVLFPTTPATMDFREDRMNVSVDKNDVIDRVYCG